MSKSVRPLILIVLDGWGVNPSKSATSKTDATQVAKTPFIDNLLANYPNTTIEASGPAVGLPKGQMGNSEVGHLTLGSGRVMHQYLSRINQSIKDGSFFKNPELINLIESLKESGRALHLTGLLSDGGVHSHIEHLYAILETAKSLSFTDVFIHVFLDGRDTAPRSALGFLEALESKLKSIGLGQIATVSGRYYAMDRDKRWERVELAYKAMTAGEGVFSSDAKTAVSDSYKNNITDEFVLPVVITKDDLPLGLIKDGDGLLSFNFRSDRSRELMDALTVEDFSGFKRGIFPRLSPVLTMTEYGAEGASKVIFYPEVLKNILGRIISEAGLTQFRVAETEKYAHVTFFFNGGIEEPFKGEERCLVPSDREVATYDQNPAMRAAEIAGFAVEQIVRKDNPPDFILLNFANGDMVGHTGVLSAAVAGCEAVDLALKLVVSAARAMGRSVIVTSDHGNAEDMINEETGKPQTAHTTNPVPFILVDDEFKGATLKAGMGLSNVAPTILKIMGIEKPTDMEGESIL
ncbi:MAG: 2,3-bisphosphoglycerate-independent phosphoglycerate mutase [Deltaproteobacteria bacterium]|nr:2,3-bisphosphoglycerate-independent phosphoglycerate mutase [Deltaproteobacteria bacterium]